MADRSQHTPSDPCRRSSARGRPRNTCQSPPARSPASSTISCTTMRNVQTASQHSTNQPAPPPPPTPPPTPFHPLTHTQVISAQKSTCPPLPAVTDGCPSCIHSAPTDGRHQTGSKMRSPEPALTLTPQPSPTETGAANNITKTHRTYSPRLKNDGSSAQLLRGGGARGRGSSRTSPPFPPHQAESPHQQTFPGTFGPSQ